MNPIRWLAARLGGYAYKARNPGVALVAGWLAGVLWTFDDTWQSLVKEGLGRNAVVYACVRKLCEAIAEARPTAYRGEGDRRQELLTTDPLRQLLKRPNELMTAFEMVELIVIHLSVVGRSLWWKERTVGGQVTALWPLRPDRVGPVYSVSQKAGERVLAGYAYQPPDASSPVLLPRGDCIAYNFPDPDGESGGIVEGLGPLSAISRQVAADNRATDHVGALLANYAQPGVVLKSPDAIATSEEDANLIKAKFRQEFGGQRLGTPGLLQGGWDIQTLGFTLRDLEFPLLRENAEARICSAFGIPAPLVGVKAGLDASTYSNFEGARRYFAEGTCSGYWRRLGDQLTNDLAVEFGEDVVVEFDTSEVRALAGQKIERLTPIKEALAAGVAMVNDYRVALGLDPLEPELGEVLYLPSNVTVVPATEAARQAIEKRKADAEEAALEKEQERAALNPPPQLPQLPAPEDGETEEEEGEEPIPPMPRKSADIVVIPLDDELAAAVGAAPGGYLVARNGHGR